MRANVASTHCDEFAGCGLVEEVVAGDAHAETTNAHSSTDLFCGFTSALFCLSRSR
jgi:hypothetical protein